MKKQDLIDFVSLPNTYTYNNVPKNDIQIAWEFFEMLKRNGVNIDYTSDNGQGFKILTTINMEETVEICFYPDGKYWRIMGTDATGFYSDEIHKDGWKNEE